MKVHFPMKKVASNLGTRGFFSRTLGSFVSSAEGRRHERRSREKKPLVPRVDGI